MSQQTPYVPSLPHLPENQFYRDNLSPEGGDRQDRMNSHVDNYEHARVCVCVCVKEDIKI